MRNLLLGLVVGLALGGSGVFAYTHFLGEGQQLVQAQSQIASTKASLTQATQDSQQLKDENTSLSSQVQQLTTRNDQLKHQIEQSPASDAATASPATPAATPMAGIMKAAIAQQNQQKLLLLESRLHLTPEQDAAVKAAMDEESKRTEEMTAKMFAGGKVDPQSLTGFKSVDQALDDILTPDQKTTYAQMKTEEKSGAAETMASSEMNQVAPLLQLSDAQKDQVYSALYQVQVNSTDPNWVKNNLPTSTDPTAILTAQAKAKEDALSKILTPDQMTTYHQQLQSQLEMQKTMMQKFMPQTSGATGSAPAPVSNP